MDEVASGVRSQESEVRSQKSEEIPPTALAKNLAHSSWFLVLGSRSGILTPDSCLLNSRFLVLGSVVLIEYSCICSNILVS